MSTTPNIKSLELQAAAAIESGDPADAKRFAQASGMAPDDFQAQLQAQGEEELALAVQAHLDQVGNVESAIDQGVEADNAFARYEFGNGVTVTDASGWEYTTPGDERSRKVYVETEREDDGPAPRWTLNFTVRFNPKTGALAEAYALDHRGEVWGHFPQRKVLNVLGAEASVPFYIWGSQDCDNKSSDFQDAKRIREELIAAGHTDVYIADADGVEVVDAEIEAQELESNSSPEKGKVEKTGVFQSPYEQYATRNGQSFVLLGPIDPATYDADDVGPMYRVKFADGEVIEAWPEEVQSALPQLENLLVETALPSSRDYQYVVLVNSMEVQKGDAGSIGILFGNLSGRNFTPRAGREQTYTEWLAKMSAKFSIELPMGAQIVMRSPEGATLSETEIGKELPAMLHDYESPSPGI